MKKGITLTVLGMFIGVVLSVSTPALAKTRTINGVFNKVKAAITKIESVQTNVTAVKTNVAALQFDVTTAQSGITTIQTDIAATQSDITAMQTDVDTINSHVSTVSTNVSYENRITEDMYDNAYYQSFLLNNIAYNTYVACLYSDVTDISDCESPSTLFISTSDLFNYEISAASMSSLGSMSIQNSQGRSITSSNPSNADALRTVLENR